MERPSSPENNAKQKGQSGAEGTRRIEVVKEKRRKDENERDRDS